MIFNAIGEVKNGKVFFCFQIKLILINHFQVKKLFKNISEMQPKNEKCTANIQSQKREKNPRTLKAA